MQYFQPRMSGTPVSSAQPGPLKCPGGCFPTYCVFWVSSIHRGTQMETFWCMLIDVCPSIWSNNPQEPQKHLQGKIKGTIKVLSGLFQVHTQAKLTCSFSSCHNDTINKAKKFLFSPNPLLYAVSRNWYSPRCKLAMRPGSLHVCLLALHHNSMGPWGPDMSLLDESLKYQKRSCKSKKTKRFGKLKLTYTKSILRKNQEQLSLSCCSWEHFRFCFHLAKIEIKSTHMYNMLSYAFPSNWMKSKW